MANLVFQLFSGKRTTLNITWLQSPKLPHSIFLKMLLRLGRLNVALTRAKQILFVVGHEQTLRNWDVLGDCLGRDLTSSQLHPVISNTFPNWYNLTTRRSSKVLRRIVKRTITWGGRCFAGIRFSEKLLHLKYLRNRFLLKNLGSRLCFCVPPYLQRFGTSQTDSFLIFSDAWCFAKNRIEANRRPLRH